jgi:hypothetical protein
MSILQKILSFFSAKEDKALLDIDGIDINSTKTTGKGQFGKVKNKNSSTTIDNSTNNYCIINLPPNITPNSPDFSTIKSEIRKQFTSKNLQFLAKQSDEIIVSYKNFEQNSQYKQTIDFFRQKISITDLQFLRTGLYIRYLLANNLKEKALKTKDGAIRNNPRARNIINLASAGYFEDYIQPIYENNDEKTFQDEYEEVVNYLPEIIFVNNSMTVEKIITEIEEKLSRSQQYHIEVKCIMINGLNQSVAIIKDAEPKIRSKYPKLKITLQVDGSNELLRGKMRIDLPLTNPDH